MKLTEYLSTCKLSKTKLCNRAKISNQTLHQLINGHTVTLPTAARIEEATYHEVTCYEIYKEFNLANDKHKDKS